VPIRRAEEERRLRLIELGVGPDADAFWFCLKPDAKRADPRFAFVRRPEFRQAISHAVDREAFAETVFLGAAVPVWGPSRRAARSVLARRSALRARRRKARAVKEIGLEDRNGSVVEDAACEARFTVITQRGIGCTERGTSVLRDELARVGIALDIAPLEFGAMIQRMLACDYDTISLPARHHRARSSGNLISGSPPAQRAWNIGQPTPADWERRIDT
jgi:peptide/nickel transport system substrate-binding protein